MATRQHDFIVSAISRKIKLNGFKIIYLDGRYQDIEIEKPDIPPKILNHRPDIVGVKNELFIIGEAKTKNDLCCQRSKQQFIDFYNITSANPENRFIIGIPMSAIDSLAHLLNELGLAETKQIEILSIPDILLPEEHEI